MINNVFIETGKNPYVYESQVNGRRATPSKKYVVLLSRCLDYAKRKDIYEPFKVKKPMSYMLNRMVSLGWVKRYTTQEAIDRGLDRLPVWYKITPYGRLLLDTAKGGRV